MFTCEICGEKPATLHVTQIHNNKKVTVHFCQECHQKHLFGSAKAPSPESLSDILQQEGAAHVGPSREELETCTGCGQTYRSFKESGKIGCEKCYDTFEKQLLPLIAKVQKSDRHVGKHPLRTSAPTREEQIAQLRRQLQLAIQAEEFERAAAFRDQIRRLENG